MVRVIAIPTDGQYDEDTQKIRVQTAVMIKPTAGENFPGQRIDTNIFLTGDETVTQINTAVNDQIRADVLAKVGVEPTNANIKVMKFT